MSQPRKAKRPRTNPTARSIWNSKDDWDTLVAESQLSTSSISTRPPQPNGLKSLTRFCAEVSGRTFKRLWELDQGGSWKYAWTEVPDRLKMPVREEVYRHWGGYLTTSMIAEVFVFPPCVNLPAKSLPVIASTERLIPFRPRKSDGYTSLSLKQATKATDTAIAGLIYSMPELEDIDLKGCTLAGSRTVDIICKKCKNLKRLNLKGTNVDEMQVREILDIYGKQIEVFKVDRLVIEAADETFIQDSYPNLRKLCLPGDVLQPGSGLFRRQSIMSGYTIAWPTAKPPPPSARFNWDKLGTLFPSLTHLSLPGLIIPPLSEIRLQSGTLIKLDLGGGGPPVPINILSTLVEQHMSTLQHVRFGDLALTRPDENLVPLFWALAQCEKLQSLEIQVEGRGRESDWMKNWIDWMYVDVMWSGALSQWEMMQLSDGDIPERKGLAPALRKFKITSRSAKPFDLDSYPSIGSIPPEVSLNESLEELYIPASNVPDTGELAQDLARYPALRILDISGIGFSEDDIFTILDGCPNLHTIDLTSCRGIKVQNRRNIFKVWEEARAPPEAETSERTGRGGRQKRKR